MRLEAAYAATTPNPREDLPHASRVHRQTGVPEEESIRAVRQELAFLAEVADVPLFLEEASDLLLDAGGRHHGRLGDSRELTGTERADAERLYLTKHPNLQEFVSSPSCALLEMAVRSLYLVSRFQNVTEFHFNP